MSEFSPSLLDSESIICILIGYCISDILIQADSSALISCEEKRFLNVCICIFRGYIHSKLGVLFNHAAIQNPNSLGRRLSQSNKDGIWNSRKRTNTNFLSELKYSNLCDNVGVYEIEWYNPEELQPGN